MRIIGGGSFGGGFSDAILAAASRQDRLREQARADQAERRRLALSAQSQRTQAAQADADMLLRQKALDAETGQREKARLLQEKSLEQENRLAADRLAAQERENAARLEQAKAEQFDRNALQYGQLQESQRYHDLQKQYRDDAIKSAENARIDAQVSRDEMNRQNRLLALGRIAMDEGDTESAQRALDEAYMTRDQLLRREGVGAEGPLIPEQAPEDPALMHARFMRKKLADIENQKRSDVEYKRSEALRLEQERNAEKETKKTEEHSKRVSSFIDRLAKMPIDRAMTVAENDEFARQYVPDAIMDHPQYSALKAIASSPEEIKRLTTQPDLMLPGAKEAASQLQAERFGMPIPQFKAVIEKLRTYREPSGNAVRIFNKAKAAGEPITMAQAEQAAAEAEQQKAGAVQPQAAPDATVPDVTDEELRRRHIANLAGQTRAVSAAEALGPRPSFAQSPLSWYFDRLASVQPEALSRAQAGAGKAYLGAVDAAGSAMTYVPRKVVGEAALAVANSPESERIRREMASRALGRLGSAPTSGEIIDMLVGGEESRIKGTGMNSKLDAAARVLGEIGLIPQTLPKIPLTKAGRQKALAAIEQANAKAPVSRLQTTPLREAPPPPMAVDPVADARTENILNELRAKRSIDEMTNPVSAPPVSRRLALVIADINDAIASGKITRGEAWKYAESIGANLDETEKGMLLQWLEQ